MSNLDFDRAVDRTLEAIEASEIIHPENKQALAGYKRDLVLDGLSMATIQKRMAHLRVVAEHVGDRRFDEMDVDDLKDLIEWVQGRTKKNGESLAVSTITAYKKIIRFFWKWMNEDDEYPDEVAWISVDTSRGKDVLPTDLLTQDDIEQQIEAAMNVRDEALIALLWETGARIGEVMGIDVGDIEDRNQGYKVVIGKTGQRGSGKTGPRRVPLVECVPYLTTWLNRHPDPKPDAPLWSKLRSNEALSYNYIRQKILLATAERAGLEKPVNPHHYRHSRASHLANYLTESQLCVWFGWAQGSDVPAKYVHLSGRDIDDAYDQLHGLSEPEDPADDTIAECMRCGELNSPSDSFCANCGAALTRDVAQDIEEAEQETTDAATQSDMELAMTIVQALREDREQVESFAAEIVE